MSALERMQNRITARREFRAAVRRDRKAHPDEYYTTIPEVMFTTVLLMPVIPLLFATTPEIAWLAALPTAAVGTLHAGKPNRVYLHRLSQGKISGSKPTADLGELQAEVIEKEVA